MELCVAYTSHKQILLHRVQISPSSVPEILEEISDSCEVSEALRHTQDFGFGYESA